MKWSRKKSTVIVGFIMIILGTLSCLGYGPLSFVKIIGMQFLDFFDFLTNSVMMPIAALMTSLFVSKVVGVDRMEEEIRHGESKFHRKKIFVVMIKYLCPIFAIIILVSSVANAFGWIFNVSVLGFNLLTGEAASQSLKETIDKDYCFLQVVTGSEC